MNTVGTVITRALPQLPGKRENRTIFTLDRPV